MGEETGMRSRLQYVGSHGWSALSTCRLAWQRGRACIALPKPLPAGSPQRPTFDTGPLPFPYIKPFPATGKYDIPFRAAHFTVPVGMSGGVAEPLGASVVASRAPPDGAAANGSGATDPRDVQCAVNFSVFSRHASSVQLCLVRVKAAQGGRKALQAVSVLEVSVCDCGTEGSKGRGTGIAWQRPVGWRSGNGRSAAYQRRGGERFRVRNGLWPGEGGLTPDRHVAKGPQHAGGVYAEGTGDAGGLGGGCGSPSSSLRHTAPCISCSLQSTLHDCTCSWS